MSAATLGARVKAAREAAGLSQRQLGIDSGLASRIESGKAVDPGIATMTAIAKATGKTVDELMGAPASAVRMVPLCDIEADPQNPRTVDVADGVDGEFVDSIRYHGLLQAVTVRRMPTDHEGAAWRIAFGGRRYAALVHIHGPKSKQPVPVLVLQSDEPSDLLLKQLVENVARADMNAADLASAIASLVDRDQDTAVIAKALKRGRRWVQEQASVGKHLTAESMRLLRSGTLNISQAVAIAAERDGEQQDKLAAHACLQGLNEDEIRAIIGDRKAKEVAAKAEAEAAAQPKLIEEEAAPKYPTADADGTFTGPPKYRHRWTNKRGHFEITLYQFGDHKWTAGYNNKWRPTTSRADEGVAKGPARRTTFVQQTAALSFLDCARTYYPIMLDRAKNHPEDVPALRELHAWAETQLEGLGATLRVLTDWKKSCPIPELPKAKPATGPVKALKPTTPPIDITKPPAWTNAEWLAGSFMLHLGQVAYLVHGWPKLLEMILADNGAEAVREMYDRSAWHNDANGKPFDYGSWVIRLTDAPA